MVTTGWWTMVAAMGVAGTLAVVAAAHGSGCEVVAPSREGWTGVASPGALPPIDRDRPARTETAVFGLG